MAIHCLVVVGPIRKGTDGPALLAPRVDHCEKGDLICLSVIH